MSCAYKRLGRSHIVLERAIPLSETANVVGQIKATGCSAAFAILMFAPK